MGGKSMTITPDGYKEDAWIKMKSNKIPNNKGGKKPYRMTGIFLKLNADQQFHLRRLKTSYDCDTWAQFADLVIDLFAEVEKK